MSDAEKQSGEADRERDKQDRAQRERITWIGLTAASYATDTLFLILFAAAGTISGTVAAAYAAAAAAISAGTYWATASGWNLKRRDRHPVKSAP